MAQAGLASPSRSPRRQQQAEGCTSLELMVTQQPAWS